MRGLLVAVSLSIAWLVCSAAQAAGLTATEERWLQGIWPVVRHAQQQKMPLDIVVQPQPTPGLPPLALGFVSGRCKLVLSMRGNPQAQATLDRIAPDLLDATLELMAAHELGHCQRHLEGRWLAAPAAASAMLAGDAADIKQPVEHAARAEMLAVRREEAFADLVGLAWARRHHAAQYTRLQSWLTAERSRDLVPQSHHDTLAWLARALDGRQLDGPTLFTGAAALWRAGLENDD